MLPDCLELKSLALICWVELRSLCLLQKHAESSQLLFPWFCQSLSHPPHPPLLRKLFPLPRWRRLLRVPWTARSNQSILKEISLECSLEELMLKLKLQYFVHLMRTANFTGKDPDAGKDWGQGEKRAAEDEMVGWRHQLNGHEFEQALGEGKGQGRLVCCSPWVSKSWTQLSD